MTNLANFMHSLGMAWIIKNPDDTGDNFAARHGAGGRRRADRAVQRVRHLRGVSSYVGHKAVFNAEYNLTTADFCSTDNALGINGVLFPVALDGTASPCR